MAYICGLDSVVFSLNKNFANQDYKGQTTLLQLGLHQYIILSSYSLPFTMEKIVLPLHFTEVSDSGSGFC